MQVNGSCGCGSVTFTAQVDSERVLVCHCRDCQRQSGSAFRVVVPVLDERFELVSGELKHFEKLADSGNMRSRSFCPECGTQIYAQTLGEGLKLMGIRVGTLEQRDQLVPGSQIWARSSQPWLADLAELPSTAVQPSDEQLGRR